MKEWAPRLALKKRLKVIWKWPIESNESTGLTIQFLSGWGGEGCLRGDFDRNKLLQPLV